MSSARIESPIPASANAANAEGRSGGRSNPSVSSDDPLVMSALRRPSCSSPEKMHANAANTTNIETNGNASRPNGAYNAITRSRDS